MRKRATDGTKINTSLSITKKTVSTSRRADRLRNSIAEPSAEAREQPHQAARARREQGRRVEIAGGALAGLAAGRVGHDEIGEGAELELLRDRQRPGQDQIAGRRTEDRRTEDTAVAASDDLNLAGGVALGLGAVIVGEG